MKPFNLEKALAGEPVITRIGMKVTEIVHFKTATNRHTVVFVADGSTYSVASNGRSFDNGIESSLDLFMAPKMVKKSGWINIYPNKKPGGTMFSTCEEANRRADGRQVATVKVEWEEEEK